MERLLHYVWKYKLYGAPHLTTTAGLPVHVLDPGLANSNPGPGFFNARIRIGSTVWAGNVELSLKASDWIRNGRHTDPAYDSVILHVVLEADTTIRRMNGELIPQTELSIPAEIVTTYEFLLHHDSPAPCLHQAKRIDRLYLISWMEALLSERLERKTADILSLLTRYKGDWNEVFYIVLTRSFGFGANNDAFEQLARSLPLRYILKHRNNIRQTEALFFGQAGMLEESNPDDYYFALQQEYRFLKHKFDLFPMPESSYRNASVRPGNFPHIKLAQLAALWSGHESLFSAVLHTYDLKSLQNLFRTEPSAYWETHYHFRYPSVRKSKPLGENALNILLINTVVPILFAYGLHTRLPEYNEQAIALLEKLPPEQNSIVASFRSAGFQTDHAADTQALIQLRHAYCEKKKCLACRIGFKLLQQNK